MLSLVDGDVFPIVQNVLVSRTDAFSVKVQLLDAVAVQPTIRAMANKAYRFPVANRSSHKRIRNRSPRSRKPASWFLMLGETFDRPLLNNSRRRIPRSDLFSFARSRASSLIRPHGDRKSYRPHGRCHRSSPSCYVSCSASA